jgi:hypothetical protein
VACRNPLKQVNYSNRNKKLHIGKTQTKSQSLKTGQLFQYLLNSSNAKAAMLASQSLKTGQLFQLSPSYIDNIVNFDDVAIP